MEDSNDQREMVEFSDGRCADARSGSTSAGQITLYGRAGFQGSNMTTTETAPNLIRSALSDTASSIVVTSGTWEACTQAYFRGRCALLAPGNYSNISGDLTSVASVRPFSDQPSSARVVVYPDTAAVTSYTATRYRNAPALVAARLRLR
jgi:hypothetical protein